MDPVVSVVLGPALAALVVAAPSIIKLFRRNTPEDVTAAAEAVNAKAALDKQIDERIKGELKRAYDRIEALEDDVSSLKAEKDAAILQANAAVAETAHIKSAVGRWWEQLQRWGANGHSDMPMPSEADRHLLEITPEPGT